MDVPALPGASLGQHQMALRWISRLTNCKADLERLAHWLMEGAAIFDATRCCLPLEREGQVAAASHGLSDHITGQLVTCSARA